MVYRTVDEIKKKWADMQSITKKKEAERRRSMAKTGGGPAPEFYFKEWEKVVLQTLSDIAIEGLSSGVDTAEWVTTPSPVKPVPSSDLSQSTTTVTVTPVPSSDLSKSAATPSTSNVSFMYTDMNAENEYSQTPENRKKQAKAPRQESEVSTLLLEMEREKMAKVEAYRAKKIKIMEEMLELQRRSTSAVESISTSMQQSGNSPPLSMSLSPVIKFS